MAVNINELKNKYRADMVYVNENDQIEKSGGMSISDDALKQVVVVLKQSLDTAECSNAKRVEFYCGNKKTLFVMTEGRIYGFIVDSGTVVKDEDLVQKDEEAAESESSSSKPKVVLKERQKIAVKSAGKKEPERAAPQEKPSAKQADAPAQSESIRADSDSLTDLKKIAVGYLDDFAEDIIDNLIKESKVDPKNPSQDDIDKILKKLQKSASLIIGPSQAQEMVEKIRKKLTL